MAPGLPELHESATVRFSIVPGLPHPMNRAQRRRWASACAAAIVLVVVLIAAFSGGGNSTSSAGSASLAPGVDSATSTTAFGAAPTTIPQVVVQTDPAIPHTQLAQTIGFGSSGTDVKMVQQRLTDLAFAPGPIDGKFGSGTQQAVWAFEKLVLQTPRANVTGKVTDAMWQTMQDNLRFDALRPTGVATTHVEIYIPQQVLIVFADDKPKLITHIATGLQKPDGTPDHFCEYANFNTDNQGAPLATTVTKYVCADTKTPGGIFKVDHMLAGDHVGPLGGMFNPVYFNFGIAMHGSGNVPKEPVSHGCVRMNETIAQFFPTLMHKGDMVYVWAQDNRQPEAYTKNESLPSFNAVTDDPNATTTTIAPTTTTTISATTTSTASTAAPPTAASATTTTKPQKPAKSTTTTLAATPQPTTTSAAATGTTGAAGG